MFDRDILKNPKIRLITDYIDVVRDKVEDLTRKIWEEQGVDAFEDQHPGKHVPFAYSKLYGPIENGTASVDEFIVPRNNNLVVGRQGPFFLCEINTAVHHQVIDTAPAGFGEKNPPDDIFSPYNRPSEGGATGARKYNVSSGDADQEALGFEVVLYDKKRGRALNEKRLPMEVLMSGSVSQRGVPEPVRFEPNTELEPRVYVLNPAAATTDNRSHSFYYLNIMFKGYVSLEDERLFEEDYRTRR